MPRYRRRKKPQRNRVVITRPRVNGQIRAPEVRLLGEDGENLGVLETSKAQSLAKEKGLDLVEVSERATPPVARIAAFGKVLYELEKKGREERKKQIHKGETKSVRIRPTTGENDLLLKAKTIDKFFKKGYKVRVEVHLRGRERALKGIADKKVEELLALIEEPHKIDKELSKSPRGLSLTLSYEA